MGIFISICLLEDESYHPGVDIVLGLLTSCDSQRWRLVSNATLRPEAEVTRPVARELLRGERPDRRDLLQN